MNPILFESTAKSFNNNGIGILSDAAFCEVTEERNGIFELVLNYPVSGLHFNKIEHRSIILAKPNATANPQPFRVYSITKPMSGMITVYAQHISYDLSGTAVRPFEAGSAAAALQALKTNSVGENPFEFWTDKSTVATMNVKTPASVRAMLGGVAGSVLDTYGGEYEWDGFTVKLYNKRGQNRGVSVRYGKNLIDLTQEENCSGVYTDVLPFWADSEGNSVMLDEETVSVEGNFDFVRVFVLDLSSEFENQPTKEELKSYTEKYIKNNKIGVPHISINLSFVQLEQTEEYKNKALLERVNLCDEVNVVFEKLGVSATAQVVKTVYNVLLNRYESVELGDAKSNFAETFVKQEQAIKDAPKQAISMAAKAAENATQLITGNRGGYVVIHSSTGQTQPDEILIMDKPTIEEAVKVWRWNNSGLGYSKNGYPGPYTSAWTIDGAFNADFITAGTLSANLIKTGLLQSFNEMTSFDMDDGKIKIKLENGVQMVFSGEGFSFIKAVESGDLTFLDQLGGINVFLNPNVGDFIYPTSKMSVYEVFDPKTQKVLGKLWDNGGTRSQLDVNGVYLRKKNDMDTEYGIFGFRNEAGRLSLKDKNASTWCDAFINENGASVLDMSDAEGGFLGAEMAVVNGRGQFVILNQGEIKGAFFASPYGAELRVGGGDSSWNMAWNIDGESHLQADHHHFWGKSEGLITSKVSASDCSAYIVAMKPTSSGGYVSVIIPSDKADGSTLWQIADDAKFCNFTINSSGKITFKSGTDVTSTALIYSIR